MCTSSTKTPKLKFIMSHRKLSDKYDPRKDFTKHVGLINSVDVCCLTNDFVKPPAGL